MYWIYLVKAAISFSILYTLFIVLVKNTTFHHLNRFILIFIVCASLIIPFINTVPLTPQINNYKIAEFTIGEFDGFIDNFSTQVIQPSRNKNTTTLIIKTLYLLGVIVFSIRFVLQLYKLLRFRFINTNKKSEKYRLIFPNKQIAPFSFFKWIFISFHDYNKPNSASIIEHEKVHANQFHSMDIIITELFSILLWFVPFVYLFKTSLKNVHEFLADTTLTKTVESKIQYLNILTQETEKYTLLGISNSFYSKNLKARISMIAKKQSSIFNAYRYLIVIPVLIVLTMAFSKSSLIEIPASLQNDSTLITKNSPLSFIQPIDKEKCRITSRFGMRVHPIKKTKMMHNAVDYAAEMGTPIMASADGIVVRKEFLENSYGKLIAIQHADGYYTLYSQLSDYKTEIGQNVKQGDIIGLVGNSGLSTGPHLHFEMRKNNEHLNPELYIK